MSLLHQTPAPPEVNIARNLGIPPSDLQDALKTLGYRILREKGEVRYATVQVIEKISRGGGTKVWSFSRSPWCVWCARCDSRHA